MKRMHNSRRPKGVLCVGRVYCDIIFTGLDRLPALGEEQYASGLSIQVGGGAYITASHLASLERPVSLLAVLPSGAFAQTVQNELSRNSINAEHCVQSEDSNDQQLTVALSIGSERAFITKRCGRALPVEKINWGDFPLTGHLHIGELATLVEHPNLLADAHDAGITVSLDCSWDDDLFERDDLEKYLKGVDIFLPNNAEFEKLKTKYTLNDSLSLCVVKQGSEGATAIHNGTLTKAAAVAANVVDTTGAGDAFNAGFIHAWLNDSKIDACIELGNQCGANTVARVGGSAQHHRQV